MLLIFSFMIKWKKKLLALSNFRGNTPSLEPWYVCIYMKGL